MPEAILQAAGLSVHFGGIAAVDKVDLTVGRGEILGLIGPNGAGKTTLFNLLTGFVAPTAGRIRFEGRDIGGWAPSRIAAAGVCRTFQATSTFPALTVEENVRTGTYVWSRHRVLGGFRGKAGGAATIEGEVASILHFLGLAAHRHVLARNLAYGDQRRLGIAIALAARSRLLLLDEPAASMNPEETRGLMHTIRQIRDRGVTVVLIEHHMQLVMMLCDRVVVLNQGRKIAEGLPAEISSDPRVVEAYLGTEAPLA